MGKMKMRKIQNENGVSEVLGDMLILAITTTLFTGVFLFVYTLPTPDEGLYADLESTLEYCDDGGWINVTHMGGETLFGEHTRLSIFKNTDEEIRFLNTQGSDDDNPTYGIQIDPNWDAGEVWTYFFGGINQSDNLRISVLDVKSNIVIMNSVLSGKWFNIPPIIMERWHYPQPAVNGSDVSIFAKVTDYDGQYDLDKVYFNASFINADLENVNMTDSDNDGIFETKVLITNGPGEYELTITAEDLGNKTEQRRMRINVTESYGPIIEFVIIEPNSVEVQTEFKIRAKILDLNHDLNFSDITIQPDSEFFEGYGEIETSLELVNEIPYGGVFETTGVSPKEADNYNLTLQAKDSVGLTTTKRIKLAVFQNDEYGNYSFNDTIWAFLGPESLDFKKFYYTIDNPPTNSSTYHVAVYIQEGHIGDDCFLHINVINHYYEDVFIDGNSRLRLLQIGGAASNKDLVIVQNGTNFGETVGTTPDGTWYRIPTAEDGDYFQGGEPVSLVFGPFDMNSAKEGDVFGTILVLCGSYGSESTDAEDRYGQTLPFQAILIA